MVRRFIMIDLRQIINHLSENIHDPVPKFIMVREVCKKAISSSEYENAYNDMKQSKWYRELADTQWKDGSWGRFHSQDSKLPKNQRFTTEGMLGRSRELSLSKDDPIITKCIKLMERYVRGEETWTDNIEKHKDNGKSHMFCRPFMTAAAINMIDPENSVIKPLRDVVAETLKTAFASGYFDENFWSQKEREYHVPGIVRPGTLYGSMLLQKTNCMKDTLQRQWLDYIWNANGGIYYVSGVPPADKQNLEDERFDQWFRTLELLSGFSLFSDYMKDDVLPHLLNETERLINGNVVCGINCRYADTSRDKNKRKTDLILRIARVLIKCWT
jgi:hypothetical protein